MEVSGIGTLNLHCHMPFGIRSCFSNMICSIGAFVDFNEDITNTVCIQRLSLCYFWVSLATRVKCINL